MIGEPSTLPTPTPTARLVLRVALIVLGVALFIYVLARIPKTIEVFLIATLIAYGVNPLIRRLSGRMPRLAAIALVYFVFFILLFVGAGIVIPTIVDQITNIFDHSGDYI